MKRYYKVFLVFLFLIIPFQSVLASSDLVIDCPIGGAIDSVIECNLFSNSDIEISAVRTNLQVSSSLEFVDFKTDSSWQGDGSNGEISLYTYPNKIGNFKLGVVSLKIKSNRTERVGTLSFRDVYFYKADFNRVSGKDISCNIKVLSTNHDLASLSLVGYSMTPQFDKNVMEYRAVVDSDVVVIEARGEDEFATVSGTGRKELNYGENVFKIVVTSEIGSKKEYQVIVTRPAPPREENSSKEENTTEQKVETGNKKEDNVVQGKEHDSRLQSLGIDGYEIDFHPDRYRYDIEVSSEVERLVVNAIPSSDKASVKIEGNEQLVIGVNEVIITVVAEDGSQSSYTIYVTKKSDVCVIQSIKIANYDLKFDCNSYEYELKIGLEDSLDIEVVPSNNKANVQILDNDHLENGDVITILVQDNGVSYQYHIKVLKSGFEIQNIVNSKQLIFVIFVVIFTLLYFVGRFLVKRKMLPHLIQKK